MLLTTCHFPPLEKWSGTAGRTYNVPPPLWYFQITTIFPLCSCYGRRVCILSSFSCCFQAVSDSIKLNESQYRTFFLCSLRTSVEFKNEITCAVWSFLKYILSYLLHHLKTQKFKKSNSKLVQWKNFGVLKYEYILFCTCRFEMRHRCDAMIPNSRLNSREYIRFSHGALWGIVGGEIHSPEKKHQLSWNNEKHIIDIKN